MRLTGIDGSDNHNAPSDPGHAGSINSPTTVVEAEELSVAAILEGIRRGRVFIDLTASHDKVIDLSATASLQRARMGESLAASASVPVTVEAHLAACEQYTVHLFLDGVEVPALPPMQIPSADATVQHQWNGDGARHWIRAEARDTNGSLVLVSNPIYINYAPAKESY
jgi:hypothetical protein